MSDRFTTDTLRATLGLRPHKFFAQVASTQDLAREWALTDPGLPRGLPGERLAIVIAEEQTAGRGRQGRAWHSPPGGSVMFSAILTPDLAPERLPRVTMLGAVAVAETLEPLLAHRIALKWPNDVLIDGKKVCGILSEAIWLGDELQAVILGIGLNVRVDFTGTDLAESATSVEPALGRAVDRLDLLNTLLARLDYWTGQLDSIYLFEAWRQRLGTLGQRVTVYPQPGVGAGLQTRPYRGIAESVDDTGALFVRTDDGNLRRVLAAEVGLAEEGG
jgi:BirA family biotin operon repressor/biotin-[acetyl-CoA-carboxylase] ligase